jgi:predicted ATP-grasp superfamily ATP-dependent carboligase
LKEKYPGSDGCISFSRVGFNNSHTQALVYVTRILKPLVGGGGYYLLEYNAGKWEIIDQFMNVNT